MNTENTLEYDEIEQDHERGPGWFLILSYIVISIFCVYYLFSNWDWQSNYDKQQTQIEREISEQH